MTAPVTPLRHADSAPVLELRGLYKTYHLGQHVVPALQGVDLLLRPVIPRFFTLDDSAQVGAVVNNTTDQALVARVTLSIGGRREAEGGSASSVFRFPPSAFVVAAHGERLVTWPVRPTALGVERLELAVSAPGVAPIGDNERGARIEVGLQPSSDGVLALVGGPIGAE